MAQSEKALMKLNKDLLIYMVEKGYMQAWYCVTCNACYLAGRAPRECACGCRDFEGGVDEENGV